MTNKEAAKILRKTFLNVVYGRCYGKKKMQSDYNEAVFKAVKLLETTPDTEEDIPDYNPYLRRWHEGTMTKDCNNCAHVSITEKQQIADKEIKLHKCMYYNERVRHDIRTLYPDHYDFLYPCEQCYKDNFEHFIERGDDQND